ncbi:response regulator [Streptomyces scopuliridis]|uniref:response regulator n=1 Tax=Streptomyces scopuliridis TaxID=452529 RepID=UPI0036907282
MIRVVLADDQAMIRSGLRALLETEPSIKVVDEAQDGADAVRLARRHRPDLVVMDLRMPRVDGVEATRRIRADPDTAQIPILVLTTFDSNAHVVAAIQAGANGFLGKAAEPNALIAAVHDVANGGASLSPAAARALVQHTAKPEPTSPHTTPETNTERERRAATLTERERQVAALVAQGLTNQEIAAHLFISPLTAKTHVNRAMRKLHARDRGQLVVAVFETGLIN